MIFKKANLEGAIKKLMDWINLKCKGLFQIIVQVKILN